MKPSAFFILLACLPLPALAHGQQLANGFISGLLHPVLGIDHLLAMLAVGVASTQVHQKAIFTLPITFVVVMALSAILALQGWYLAYIELGIALSVLLLGLAIHLVLKFKFDWVNVLIYLAVALFAIFHGYAHGAEIPNAAKPSNFITGFIIASAAIHCAGIFIGRGSARKDKIHWRVSHFATAIASIGAMMSYLYIESWWG